MRPIERMKTNKVVSKPDLAAIDKMRTTIGPDLGDIRREFLESLSIDPAGADPFRDSFPLADGRGSFYPC